MTTIRDEVYGTASSVKGRNGHMLVTNEDYPTRQSFRFAVGVQGAPELIKITFGKPFLLTTRKVSLFGTGQVVMTSYVEGGVQVDTDPTTQITIHNRDMIQALPSAAGAYRGGTATPGDDFLDEAVVNEAHALDLMVSPRALPAGNYYIYVAADTTSGCVLSLEWTELG